MPRSTVILFKKVKCGGGGGGKELYCHLLELVVWLYLEYRGLVCVSHVVVYVTQLVVYHVEVVQADVCAHQYPEIKRGTENQTVVSCKHRVSIEIPTSTLKRLRVGIDLSMCT